MGWYVWDCGQGIEANGLYLSPAFDVACWRHNPMSDERTRGIWAVTVHLTTAGYTAMGKALLTRPAVVDDFGTLVCVGEAR